MCFSRRLFPPVPWSAQVQRWANQRSGRTSGRWWGPLKMDGMIFLSPLYLHTYTQVHAHTHIYGGQRAGRWRGLDIRGMGEQETEWRTYIHGYIYKSSSSSSSSNGSSSGSSSNRYILLEGKERWGKNCHWLRVKQLICRLIWIFHYSFFPTSARGEGGRWLDGRDQDFVFRQTPTFVRMTIRGIFFCS